MSTMSLNQPYGTIYGHDTARYSQAGKLYDAQYRLIAPDKPAAKVVAVQDLGRLANAKAFLLQVLKENPLSKSVIYKEVEQNNQVWNDVRDAAADLGVIKFTQKNLEMWRLPEGAAA